MAAKGSFPGIPKLLVNGGAVAMGASRVRHLGDGNAA